MPRWSRKLIAFVTMSTMRLRESTRRPIHLIADARVHDPVKNQMLRTELSFEPQRRQLVRRLQ
jgi:hypothetical protein